MNKWIVVVFICSLALAAGSCSRQGTEQKESAPPSGSQRDQKHGTPDADAPETDVALPAKKAPGGEVPGEGSAGEWKEPKELGPAGHAMDPVAQAVCDAGFAADPDGIFNTLHPRVREYLEEGNAAGMDDISIDALKQEMRQSMLEDKIQKCEPGAAVLLECEQHIADMYEELGLNLEACGKVSIDATLKQAGVMEEQIYTARVDGKWYLNDM